MEMDKCHLPQVMYGDSLEQNGLQHEEPIQIQFAVKKEKEKSEILHTFV